MKNYIETKLNLFCGVGNWSKTSTGGYTFKRILSDDEFILITNNVELIFDNYVLVIDENKGIELGFMDVEEVQFEAYNLTSYAVKINKAMFDHIDFYVFEEEYSPSQENNFENLKKVAETQEKENYSFKFNDDMF